MPSLEINYSPHPKQAEIHNDQTRFKVVAAGRRFGKTVLAINELLKAALTHPQRDNLPIQRSWYICDTYKHAEMIAWRSFFKFCPPELIHSRNIAKLQVELINGHIVEFKGSEDPDKLRGVALVFAVLDEYGNMKPEVWTDVIRASLVDMRGKALFIGTPSADGSPHFQDMWQLGNSGTDTNYKSWMCYTLDNPNIPRDEIERARQELPPDIFKREFMADFSVSAGLIYDNFKARNVIPSYVPDAGDFIVGAIDPGLHNPTAALLCAWDRDGVGRVFWEYYQTGKLAFENANAIKKATEQYKVAYWVIDRASKKRDPASGFAVYDKFTEVLRPMMTAPTDAISIWTGIDEVKKFFQADEKTGQPRLYVSSKCEKFVWELGRYTLYKSKYHTDKNPEEKPRKYHDHLMDAVRYMIMTRPWLRTNMSQWYKPQSRPTGY